MEEKLTAAIGDASEIKLSGVSVHILETDEHVRKIPTAKIMEIKNPYEPMVFDTIASNIGHGVAACVKIQQKLGQPLP